MAEPQVWIFFYGSFINRHVLARGGASRRDLRASGVRGCRSGLRTSSLRRSPCRVWRS
jgi:hypothetical protein